jgi:hypothetical protein
MRAVITEGKSIPGLILVGISLATFIVGLVGSNEFREVSRWFPMGVSIGGIVLALAGLPWELGIVTAWGIRECQVRRQRG